MRTKTCLKSATMSAALLFCMVQTLHAAEAPYGGTPAAIPGTVLAENYDTGGQGVAYNVTSTNGTDNAYRSDGVDLETATSPATGNDLGWTGTGQWFRYIVNVATAGTYTVSFRVAAPSAVTDAFHVSNAFGTDLSGPVNIPATGGFQTWATPAKSTRQKGALSGTQLRRVWHREYNAHCQAETSDQPPEKMAVAWGRLV